ncbi:unnamed protein product [Toxocara canis]|uniref:Polysacc_synt_4 domain-containing protein n=1 Tax=Toxocara canis TaxID=6265 RepID=A0A183UJQ0_TOXCA|nr:unnamed protein product [Toxocara canis]
MSFKESDFTSLASRDIAAQLTQDVQQYANDPSCEVAWACKAAERASIHMNLLLGCNTVELSLNKQHAAIYECFREMFPEMNVENVAEADLKGENKMKWFTFCERFKDSVEEYNLGTILRMRADGAYSEENTIIVPKVQYFLYHLNLNNLIPLQTIHCRHSRSSSPSERRLEWAVSEMRVYFQIIFLAIEAARNKEGVNERAKEHYKREHERINREGGNIC